MKELSPAIMGGDPFSDIFRGLYDPRSFWNLTDPDYCLSVMRSAYEGGCRAFDYSFANVQDIFVRLRESVDEEIVGYANPTYLQGTMLDGKHLQFQRSRILKTIVSVPSFVEPEIASKIRDDLREKTCMVFGYDPDAAALSDSEIASIYLDEDVFNKRLDELNESTFVLIGGTDADWLFTLKRADIIVRMAEIVRSRGKIPLLICHYTSTVLPEADRINLDVEGYFAPINKSWSWFDLKESQKAVRAAKKPVIAFMAFACGSLSNGMQEAADFLKQECGVSGVLFGTTKVKNALNTSIMLTETFGKTISK